MKINKKQLKQIRTVAGRIKFIREQRNYAQIGVAMGAGISQKAFSKIELGITKPNLERLYDIAESLDVDIYDLIPPTRPNEMLSGDTVFGRLLQFARRWWRKRN